MTKLVLEIPSKKTLEALLPLLKHLKIRFTQIDPLIKTDEEIKEALKIIQNGCDTSNFGDALEYQMEARQERSLPFRN